MPRGSNFFFFFLRSRHSLASVLGTVGDGHGPGVTRCRAHDTDDCVGRQASVRCVVQNETTSVL